MVNVYEEEQKFSQWWIYLILGGLFFVATVSLAEPGNFNVDSFSFFILSLFLIVLFAALRLNTKISQSEISVKYYPFFKKTFQWKDIESVDLINYGFVGGWGIRFTRKYGTVYNTSGNKGLLVKLKNGKKFIVGTKNIDEMREYLKKLGKLT